MATCYGLGSLGIESWWGMRFSMPVQTSTGAYPATYMMGTGSFLGVKQPGCGIDQPPPSSTKVKKRVELHLNSLSGPSCTFPGCTLPFIFIQVSQEECARLRESVPYVKVYRCNPKHLYPKLNGYGDNGQRKVRSYCCSTYCTFSADTLHVLCACR